jgi:hypothetical protein
MSKKEALIQAMVAKRVKTKKANPDDAELAADGVLAAVKAGDKAALAKALRDFVDISGT